MAGKGSNSKEEPEDGITNTNLQKQTPDSGSHDSCEVAPPVPPDGGYGWMIMFASFICNVIVDGVCFSFGIFFLEFLRYYGESKSKTSWVGSVLNGMYLSMGPITSALANRFGCRAVTIAGSIVACLAFFLSIYSPNINVLILTYGALGGAGFGLMYLPAIVMVGYYFEKKRAFATGIAVCGSGIGAFVFAPLTEFLISYYGWKGATIIVAGIALNGVVMGALFRPLEATCQKKSSLKQVENGQCGNSKPITNGGSPDIYIENTEDTNIIVNGGAKLHVNGTVNMHGVEPSQLLKTKLAADVNQCYSMHDLSLPVPQITSNRTLTSRPFSQSETNLHHSHKKDTHPELHQRARDIKRPMYRKDIFYSGSVMNLPEYKMSNKDITYTQSITNIPRDSNNDTEPGSRKGCLRICKSFADTLGEMMDFSLMKNPVFALYGASCFLCMTGFFVPFMYLPDNAILKGVPRSQAAFLLSIIGIANTVARVLAGWVSDRPWADSLLINNMALILGGVATIFCPFCNTYGLLAAYAAIFGSAIAVFVSLRSIIMVELLGLEKLTNAFGLVTMCQGFSAFIGAPIAGALYDATGDYSISFYFAGTTLLLAGLICLPLRRIANWHKRKEEAEANSIHHQSPEEQNVMI